MKKEPYLHEITVCTHFRFFLTFFRAITIETKLVLGTTAKKKVTGFTSVHQTAKEEKNCFNLSKKERRVILKERTSAY